MKITLVTGSKQKLDEWKRILPGTVELDVVDLDLDEIQSLDLSQIALDKARRAYSLVNKPVVVEDLSVGIDSLNGLPGPFIKFFIKKLGKDCLIKLAGREGQPAEVTCTIAYCDGVDELFVDATVRGVCVTPRGDNGFGFDFGFIPEGQTKTYAEMTPSEKDSVSHRSLAINKFVTILESR